MSNQKPLCIDLYAGLGGWAEGALAEGFDVLGFDIERHQYGENRYPAQLVIQDVLTLHGSQFKDAALILASPPCQEYSYMAMPWSRGKQIARALRGEDEFPEGYSGSRTISELNQLFDACFRLQREACEAAGRHIPMVVENVRGAQAWVGRAKWNFGSYYLWGDVPALMPIVKKAIKAPGRRSFTESGGAHKNPGFRFDRSGKSFQSESVNTHIKGGGGAWFNDYKSRAEKPSSLLSMTSSKSPARKAASAAIAKIPFQLSRYIASVYYPVENSPSNPLARRREHPDSAVAGL